MPVRNHKAVLAMIPSLVLGSLLQAQAAPRPTTRTRTCVSEGCHDTYRTMKHVHPPVASNVCKFCHRVADPQQHTFKLLREDGGLCEYCHWDRQREIEENGHRSLGGGECTACHNPHATDYPFLLPGPKAEDACRRCHSGLLEGKRALHAPVAAGECTACHDAHRSDHGKLLKTAPGQLCFECHEVTRKELERFEHVHAPVSQTGCGTCHDPHGSDNAMHLKEAVPALCFSCHPEVSSAAQHAEHKHSLLEREGGCLACHTPHASSAQFLLKSDPMSLCLACHDKEIVTQDGKKIANIKPQIEGVKYLHGPVAQKDCEACHAGHGSEHFRLLIGEYPSEFYAPFERESYTLCFTCHPDKSMLTRETTDLTDFRNGPLNLHYLHVNKAERGRTCRACHATHGSNQPKHIRESVPFGQWEIPLEFNKTATGGGCKTGCHEPKTYDRLSPVNYGRAASGPATSRPSQKAPSSQPQTGFPRDQSERGVTEHAS